MTENVKTYEVVLSGKVQGVGAELFAMENSVGNSGEVNGMAFAEGSGGDRRSAALVDERGQDVGVMFDVDFNGVLQCQDGSVYASDPVCGYFIGPWQIGKGRMVGG